MAMADTIPEVWSRVTSALLEKRLQANGLVNTSYEGEIRNVGDTVKITIPSDVTVSEYTGADITVQALDPTVSSLVIDEEDYFAFGIDSLTELQSAIDNKNSGITRGVYKLADKIDKHAFAQFGDAGTISYETATNPWTLGATGQEVPKFLGALVQQAEDAGIPIDGLVLVAPPAFRNALTQHFGSTGDGVSTLVNVRGAMGQMYMGVNVVISGNLTTAASATNGLAFNLNDQGLALATQMLGVEEVPNTLKRGSIVKGFSAYGAKVYDPSKVINVKFAEALLA